MPIPDNVPQSEHMDGTYTRVHKGCYFNMESYKEDLKEEFMDDVFRRMDKEPKEKFFEMLYDKALYWALDTGRKPDLTPARHIYYFIDLLDTVHTTLRVYKQSM